MTLRGCISPIPVPEATRLSDKGDSKFSDPGRGVEGRQELRQQLRLQRGGVGRRPGHLGGKAEGVAFEEVGNHF